MLQPHDYRQALGPNGYNVAYQRTGVYKGMYKGMGALGQVCCDPECTQIGPCLPYYGVPTSPQTPATLTGWVQQNGAVILVGVIVVALLIGGRR